MNLSSLRLGQAFGLLMRTLPILLIRLGVTVAFWVVALIYLAIVGYVAFLIAQAVEFLGFIIFIVALISVIPIYNLAYRYFFYMIKAAHIAVMSELLVHGKLKASGGQLQYGRERVMERFGEMNAMFVIDELVHGVVRSFTRTVYNVARWIPGDTVEALVRILNRVIEYSMSYIDEAVLARSFWVEEQNVWENARDGVVLYAMSWRPILMAAVSLTVLSFLPGLVAFLVFAAPIGFLVSLINPQLAGWTIIFLLLFAWLIKVAIGDAFAVAAIITNYYEETKAMQPDAEMAARLDQVSDAFGDLKKRAQDAMSSKEQTSAAGMDGTPVSET